MTPWRWLEKDLILAVHDEQIAEHGGRPGVRDIGLLESALARPLNRAAYGDASVFDMAAAYAFGIIRNHPFFDGNKRVALIAAALFLGEHGREIVASDAAVVVAVLALADGSLDEAGFAAWLAEHTIPVPEIL